MKKGISSILEYAQEMVKQNVCGNGDCISLRSGDKMYISNKSVLIKDLTENDITIVDINNPTTDEEKLHAAVYTSKPEVNSICHAHPAWVNPVAECKLTIPAVLDDMTQIVGPHCKTVKNDINSIVKELKKSNSLLIVGDGCLTTGRTLNEAYTCVLVLDKAAHCYVASAVVKKNVIINPFEAKLMRFVYVKKYSKKNQENLQNLEEEN